MGRHAKPTALKVVGGNAGKRPMNKQEPDPAYLNDLDPPEHLSEESKAVWNELAPKLRDAQLLTELDVHSLEMACDAIAQYRRATRNIGENDLTTHAENGGEVLNPWAIVQSMSYKRASAILSKFGCSPVDRARIAIQPQGDLFRDTLGDYMRNKPAA